MGFWDILASYTKVETVISLLAFIVAAVLGYLAYVYKTKQEGAAKIIGLADTENKADLARSLMGVDPTYKIPDLTKAQGFELVKMQFTRKAAEFKSRTITLRMVVILLFLAICGLFTKNAITVNKNSTIGPESPILIGPNPKANFTNGDTTAKKDSLIFKDSVSKKDK